MSVDIQREGRRRVAQVALDRFDIVAVLQGQHGVGMSEVMHSGVWGADLSSKLFEVVLDSLRVQMSSEGSGKYQGRFALLFVFPPLPLPAGSQPVFCLGLLPAL